MRIMAVLGLCLAVAAGSADAQEKLTWVDLAKDLTDLERLARLPAAGEKCGQFSSYDRASRFDEGSGKYVAWDANGDGHGVIRTEGGWQVLAEMTGPGCIRRIWSADPRGGRVRIFIDGAAEPTVDLPFIGYFNRANRPFTGASLVHKTASGYNNYVPIPYQKSCKIVAEPGWGMYYHFTYQTFPEKTEVPTFTCELPADATAALEKADAFLAGKLGVDPAGERPGEKVVRVVVRAEPGKSTEVLDLAGARAITAIRVKMDLPPSPQDRRMLRELALTIRWDDQAAADVWSPLGDFFGTAPGRNTYRSLPLGVTDDGWWYCYWYMPFATRALVELRNDGTVPREVTFEITHAPLSRPIDQLGRFHVKWHRDAFPPAEPERRLDWTMLKTTGRGRFCGVMLHVWNPAGGWWGEGDEKFFVDGEKFPSTFGTGSEDYFGYAWCDPALFQHAYHNQTLSMGNQGHISVNRWHIADDVPFHKSFEASIEKYSPNDRPTLYASTVYWYLAAGGDDLYAECPVAERVAADWPPAVPPVQGAPVAQVREGVTPPPAAVTGVAPATEGHSNSPE